MSTSQSDKNYLIVGGTGGIGSALTQRVAETGANVFVVSRNAPDDKIDGVTYLQADVLEGKLQLDELPDELHGVAYCAGSITLKPFNSLKDEDFLNDYKINVLGAVHVLQGVMKHLRKSKDASVVLFSTVASTVGMPYHASIAAAKSAVEGLAKSLAAEWSKQNIRVNLVAPSITDTPMAEKLLDSEQKRENSAERHPIQRIGQPEDMAAAAFFLLTDAPWMSGQVLGVDGGMSSLRML
ncbi:MAG: SDR family NAD(P)-dependent oxidoreductase [Bacteroidota bacterium]